MKILKMIRNLIYNYLVFLTMFVWIYFWFLGQIKKKDFVGTFITGKFCFIDSWEIEQNDNI